MEVYALHENWEEPGIRRMKKSLVFALLMLLVAVLCCAAEAEEPVPATPTDLTCLHKNTKQTIFFFDSPAYTSVSSTSHRVYGPATIQTVCLDCGEVISSETVDYAEELCPHSMKRGQCVLCGYCDQTWTKQEQPKDTAGERTLYAQEDQNNSGLLFMVLSREDLIALNNSSVSVALIRGNSGNVAIALNVKNLLDQSREADADLYVQLAERTDGSVFAGVTLVSESGEEIAPATDGINLRIYQETYSNIHFSLAASAGGALVEAEGVWDEHGYWSVRYQEEGTYFILQ